MTGEVEQLQQGVLGRIEQQLLAEEVLTGVAREAQLGEGDDLHALPLSLNDERLNLFEVLHAVGHLHGGHGTGHFDESVFHVMGIFLWS